MPDQLRLDIEMQGELETLWASVLDHVEAELGQEAIASWLQDAVPVALEGGTFVLGVPNSTARAWVEKKYARRLAAALSDLQGEPLRLEVVVHRATKRAARSTTSPTPAPPASVSAAPPPRPAVSAAFAPIPLNEKYTFENFVVGQSNRFAHAAAAAVADQPGKEYNPLFLYGGVGLGKTHLLQAIGHELLVRNPHARVAYVSGETFTSHFITSLRDRKAEEFRRAYRSVDIWLVDDIQFIADKSSTKEEFFHTFNELYLTNRQVVLASDRAPRELRLMEDRLRTRLEAGLMVEILPPELEMRVAILQRRAAQEGADVPPDVLYQIACTVTDSTRVLEAALIRMLALASLTRSSVTPELAARALGAFVQESRVAGISLLSIQRAVCEYFKISEQEVIGPRRDRQTALARQVAMYLMRELTRKSLVEIGELFGGKTHSTVIYSCGKLEKELKTDAGLAASVKELRAKIAASSRE